MRAADERSVAVLLEAGATAEPHFFTRMRMHVHMHMHMHVHMHMHTDTHTDTLAHMYLCTDVRTIRTPLPMRTLLQVLHQISSSGQD